MRQDIEKYKNSYDRLAGEYTRHIYDELKDKPFDRGLLDRFALLWFDPSNNIGMFDPVGCGTAFQRRGLTRAIMLEGLRRLKRLGGKTAIVCSSGSDEGTTRFYQAVGFKELDRNYTWEKELGR